MALKDLRAVLSDGHRLPINGKTYTIPHASAEAGLVFAEMLAIAERSSKAEKDGTPLELDPEDYPLLTDAGETDLYRDVLADTYDEFLADGVPFYGVKLAATYSLLHAVMGEAQAEAFWNAGGKAPRPNRAARRTATRTHTAAASTTKPRASRSGTSTPKGGPRTKGSSGTTSTSTGT